MLPENHLWPIDDWWDFHAGEAAFKDIHVYADALAARYGTANNVEDFSLKSQLMAYEGIRAMFEAYSRNKYTATGVIQWMLNNAWPSTIWHLYDYYLRPGGGYFGAKRALEPLHPLYSQTDHSVWLVSSQYKDAKVLTLTAKIYNLNLEEKFSNVTTLDVPADTTNKVFNLPVIEGLTRTYFPRLTLEDGNRKLLSSNFYWISLKPEVLDWQHSRYPATPTASHADYTALNSLPKVTLKLDSYTELRGEQALTHVTIGNPSKYLAFFSRLKASNPTSSSEILPVIWQDNYFSLMPGEKREVTAEYRRSDLSPAPNPVVSASGWNVSP